MNSSFSLETLHEEDVVVYLKNERTGSSTIRKCKFVGMIIGFAGKKVKIHRLSKPDTFVTPNEIEDFGFDTVDENEIVHIILSKYIKST